MSVSYVHTNKIINWDWDERPFQGICIEKNAFSPVTGTCESRQ